MKKQYIKIIWKRRKHNRYLLLEFLLSFMVLFLISMLVIRLVINKTQPLGFKYKNVWRMGFVRLDTKSSDETNQEIVEMGELIKSFYEVEYYSQILKNHPFVFNYTYVDRFIYDSVSYHKVYFCPVNDNFHKLFELNIVEGRWYGDEDNGSNYHPIVINLHLKNTLFKNENAIGKVVDVFASKKKCIITGIVDDFRYIGDYSNSRDFFFIRNVDDTNLAYKNKFWGTSTNMGTRDYNYFKVKEGTDLTFEEKLVNELSRKYPLWQVDITPLTKVRKSYLTKVWIPLIILFLVALFLVFNVLLSLIGVLWYSISLRKSEIGIRMAVGASKKSIYYQFISEMLVLATMGLVPGLIIAAQFPILKVFNLETEVYIMAMMVATMIIYLLVALSALLPTAQAAKIQPAMALHEE